ncbi:MAG: Uncharacterized protein G01um101433_711 [Parcubacteria group bacterium Gr01-1014_33]|nr:MAG: Uncharacterized protein G01um101433_711 [Parcubacteria group bacterium Gr01-1014_33]
MNSETKQCQNCKTEFLIEPDDFLFYEKIKVPPPTFCPECRMIRRMMFRNERVLYKRNVIGWDEPVFSIFPESSEFKVYYQKDWQSADFDALDFGRDYDFSRPFFEQIKTLMREVPWQHSFNQNAVESEYCNNAMDLKKCYLMFNSGMCENCFYGTDVLHSNDSLDLLDVSYGERSYELIHSERCHTCFFSTDLVECADVLFSHNLTNCHDCIGSVGLRNKQYCIFNKQFTREEYLKEKEKFDFGSARVRKELEAKIEDLRLGFPVKFMHGFSNVNSTGDYLRNCKDARQCFISRGLETCAYCQKILFGTALFGAGHDRDSYDLTIAAGERGYENCIGGGYNVRFSWLSVFHSDITYSMNCMNSTHIFGCVGLRNKEHCILNKQYTKKDYDALVPKIIQQMNDLPYKDTRGKIYAFGEFFPPELSPHAYNDTIAQEFFPLTKEEAREKGYSWRDLEERQYPITVFTNRLADHIKDVSDSILGETIECGHRGKCNEDCATAFRIIPKELAFYREINLPLPRLCPNCRHYQRLKMRNPLRLWHRKCQCAGVQSKNSLYQNTASHSHGSSPCLNEFETSYSPDRKEIVYCEACYNQEVI